MITAALVAFFTAIASMFSQSVEFMRSISPFASRVAVAQHQAVQVVHQQAQLICGVCQARLEQNAQDIIVTACNGVFHGAHIECMRTALLHQDVLTCPTCDTALSESNTEHVMLVLNGDDVRPGSQPSAPISAPLSMPIIPSNLYPDLEAIAPMMPSSFNDHGYHAQPSAPIVRECSICFETLSSDDTRALPCAHVFHEDCVGQWLQQQRNCPICRISC